MLRLLLVLGLLSAGAAQAQSIVLNATGSTSDTVRFRSTACVNDLQITWTSTVFTSLCTSLRLWSTESECGDAPVGNDVIYTDVSQTDVQLKHTANFTIHLDELPAFKGGDAGVVCGTESIEKPMKICGSYSTATTVVGAACTVQHATSLNIIYDMLPPDAPTIDSLSEQDSALKVQFTVDTDAFAVHFEAKGPDDADFTERSSVEVTTGNGATIPHLVNGNTYDLRAIAEDAAGNLSEPSETVSGTPRHTAGFWTQFRRDGGTEQGGCSAIHGLPIALAAGLWLVRRKRT